MSGLKRLSSAAVVFIASVLLANTATASPSITLSKKSGPPTSGILVSGRGFEPNVAVDVYFDTKDDALVITNAKGEFDQAKINAPRSARPGKHWVTAVERNNDKGAQEPFLVRANWSQFNFQYDGTRLNPYENVLSTQTVPNLEPRWTYNTGYAVDSSPAVVDGVVYVGCGETSICALKATSGKLLWSYATGDYVFSSPTVVNGVVYVGSFDGNVYALNSASGEKLWSYAAGSSILCSPAVANGVLYIGGDHNVYALNASTGAQLWVYDTNWYVSTSPAVVNGVVYIGSQDHNVYALEAATGVPIWIHALADSVMATAIVVANGIVYANSGVNYNDFYALDARNGSILWKYTSNHGWLSSPAVADGIVYFGSYTGGVLAMNARTGRLIWNAPPSLLVESSPALANGLLYVGSDSYDLFVLDARTGAKLWKYHTGKAVQSSPAVANGMVCVGSEDGNVYAFGLSHDDESKQEATSKRPDLKKLHPDFSLKVSRSVTPP